MHAAIFIGCLLFGWPVFIIAAFSPLMQWTAAILGLGLVALSITDKLWPRHAGWWLLPLGYVLGTSFFLGWCIFLFWVSHH